MISQLGVGACGTTWVNPHQPDCSIPASWLGDGIIENENTLTKEVQNFEKGSEKMHHHNSFEIRANLGQLRLGEKEQKMLRDPREMENGAENFDKGKCVCSWDNVCVDYAM